MEFIATYLLSSFRSAWPLAAMIFGSKLSSTFLSPVEHEISDVDLAIRLRHGRGLNEASKLQKQPNQQDVDLEPSTA